MMKKCWSREFPDRRAAFALLAVSFVVSRLLYFTSGVRFDASSLKFYWQFADPQLLRTDLWRTIFYLEQQPPGFNFFLGAVLKLFGVHSTLAFQLIYLALGLILPLALFELMDRMGADRRIAAAIALVFAVSPSTVLYENLLFYEYPLTVLFCIAALFLYRFAGRGKFSDGVIFFSAIASIALIRSVFHLAWFLLVLFGLAWALERWRKRVLLAAAIPGIMLGAYYVKHFIMFQTLVPGGTVYMGINTYITLTVPVPETSIDELIAAGKITPVLRMNIFHLDDEFGHDPAGSSIARIVPVPPKTGVPIRDECKKSTGWINWNCAWAQAVSRRYLHDSLVVFRHYPGAYVESLRGNLSRYFLSDTKGWPFDGRDGDDNQQILSRPLAIYNLIRSGEWPGRIRQPWVSYIALPVLLSYGLVQLFSSLRRARRTGSLLSPAKIALIFMIANIVYLSLVTLLFSESDQNRYRTEVSTYYAVLLGLVFTRLMRRTQAKRKTTEAESSPALSHA